MKSLLALVTLALTALVLEDKARQVAGDTHEAIGTAVVQFNDAKDALTHKIEELPLVSLLIAGGLAYALATIIPTRR